MAAAKPPWKRQRPSTKKKSVRLTAEWRHKARERARRAGRRYPNLVDNMWAASQRKKSRSSAKKKR
jgi:hypothetical protein